MVQKSSSLRVYLVLIKNIKILPKTIKEILYERCKSYKRIASICSYQYIDTNRLDDFKKYILSFKKDKIVFLQFLFFHLVYILDNNIFTKKELETFIKKSNLPSLKNRYFFLKNIYNDLSMTK